MNGKQKIARIMNRNPGKSERLRLRLLLSAVSVVAWAGVMLYSMALAFGGAQ